MRDLTGQTFGQLTAIRPVARYGDGQIIWEFSCTCGNTAELIGASVTKRAKKDSEGILSSCGCIRSQRQAAKMYKHGYGKHRLRDILTAMIQRCTNPNNKDYPAYGGRGVTVCEDWTNNPEAFFTWATTNGWYLGCHVDKDIKGGKVYGPSTCSIVSPSENLSHKRVRTKIG